MTDHGRSLTTAPEEGAIPPASSESGAQGSRPGGSLPQEQSDVGRQPAILCEECHDAGVDEVARPGCGPLAALKWRQKEKLKTTAVALVLCLNIGVDPPDVIKISPCARLECWVDPLSMQPARALETIGKNLQAQYERWQPKAKYKMHLDPTVEDVKKLAVSSRKNAKAERTLFHYNGHGVPRPTANGELWVFNSRYTQYIPLSVFELHSWLGTPCIYVLDCSSAGVVINSFKAMLEQRVGSFPGSQPGAPAANDPLREIIVLAACGANEVLPQNPELPADVFTSCLTTPIKVSLRWFCSRSLLRHDGITKELIDKIPGKQTDRKTPLGELNWIFTAITDTIAWDVLPRPLFQKLFRSDLLVASLFRNFLLAQRIMSSANCCPVSYPRLPPTHQHPLWQAWDMAAEMCLMQLPTLLSDPGVQFQASPFFTEQLTAFELWLASGGRDKKPPEQLPIVLQVLLSTVHRLRALVLLGRFLDMGPWAVDLALSVGIFPYVLKLLVTTSQDLRATLVFIWAKILVLDTSCQVDLVKDNGHTYFITFLDAVDPGVELSSRAQATFVLAAICDNHPKGQRLCTESDLLLRLLNWLRQLFPPQVPFPTPGHGLLLKWLCLCLGKLCQDNPGISLNAIREGAADLLVQLLTVASPEIRAAAVFGLGCLVHSGRTAGAAGVVGGPDAPEPPTEDRLPAEQLIANAVRQVVYDPSVLVRCELAVLYARFVRGHAPMVQEALGQQQRRLQEFAAKQQQAAQSALQASGGSQTQRRSGEGGPLAGETEASWLQRSMSAATSTSAVGLRVGEATTEALPAASHLSTSPSRPSSCPPGSSGLPSSPPPSAPSAGRAASPTHTTYSALLESIQMLALDPAPKVGKLGRDVLRVASCELTFLGQPTASASTPTASSTPASPQFSTGNALGAFTQKLRPYSWGRTSSATTAGSTGAAGGAAGAGAGLPGMGAAAAALAAGQGQGSGSTSSNSPASPFKEPGMAFSRHPYVLRMAVDLADQDVADTSHSSSSRATTAAPHLHASHPNHFSPATPPWPGASGEPGGGGPGASQAGTGAAGAALPASLIYRMSADAFSRPQLEPMASAWQEGEAGHPHAWSVPVDPARRAFRVREIELGILRSRALSAPKLREQVYSVETGSEGVCALAFHPYHPLLCAADTRGFIKVSNFNDSTNINAFHVTNGMPLHDTRAPYLPSTINFLHHVNEADGPMLLAGSTDGAVRVWRSHTLPGSQRMATALQAVTIHLPPQQGRNTAFAWCRHKSHLFAAGGSHPDMIYCWDLMYEMCSNMIPMNMTPSAASTGTMPVVAVDRIMLGSDPSLLLAACNDATLRLFDIRASRVAAMVLAPFKQPPAGVAFELAGRQGIIAAASERGELKLMDIRQAYSAMSAASAAGAPMPGMAELSATATYKTVAAHSKGGVTALVAHAYAPLLATGTTNQVVKVWTESCEVVGAIRAQNMLSSNKVGSVTSMAWHPYQPLLAAGGSDSVCTVYAIDQNTSAAAGRSIGPSSTTQYSATSSAASFG